MAVADFEGGYTGRTLRVNLTTGAIGVEETPDVCRWLGPRGWNAKIAWDEIRPGVGPFDPENRIVFSVGPLAGTPAPTSGRTTVSTVGPRGYPEPSFSSGTMGGYFGAELKYAGYDIIIIQGRAESPSYLLIQDDVATIQDARALWGAGVFATQRSMKAMHGRACQVAAIGPAGENRVRFASILHRLSNAIGNAGFGGVMGAKNLKAIVVRGTGGVKLARPQAFLDAVRYTQGLTKGGQGWVGSVQQGYPAVACTHACSVACQTRMVPCPGILQHDVGSIMWKCVDRAWAVGGHPEYRGTFLGDGASGQEVFVPRAPGMGPLGWDLLSIVNDMGITAWAYETWYRYFAALRGLGIDSIEGEPIALDSPEWWRSWILRVSRRDGLGNDYAEGLARFWTRHPVGPRYLAEFLESAGSRGHGWHRDGRLMEPHPSPYWEYAALLYAVSTRDVTPSTHKFFFLNRLYGYPEKPRNPADIPARLQALAQQIYGSRRAVWPGTEHIESVVAWHQHRAIIKDSLPLCDWIFPRMVGNFETQNEFDHAGDLYGDVAAEAMLYRACTGLELGIEEMESPIAERVVNLERAIDVRNGHRSRKDDEAVIPHFQWPEKTDGTHISADANEFRALLDRYYAHRGWDPDTGRPGRPRLEALGLKDVADDLDLAGQPSAASPARANPNGAASTQ